MTRSSFHRVLLVASLWACACSRTTAVQAGESSPASASTVAPAPASPRAPDATLRHLEGRSGTPGALWGEASFKQKRKSGKLVRQLELDVENAPPGAAQALVLDGFDLGPVKASKKGSLEFEISEEDEQLFPAGFREPEVGSVLRVGTLMELRFEVLTKLTDLEALLSGPGSLTGKVGFKIERLGSAVTREFQVKLEKGPANTLHAVTLDGVHVGDLPIDLEGTGKLKFSSKKPPAFPAGFPEPHAGSTVHVGELFDVQLTDALAAPPR